MHTVPGIKVNLGLIKIFLLTSNFEYVTITTIENFVYYTTTAVSSLPSGISENMVGLYR